MLKWYWVKATRDIEANFLGESLPRKANGTSTKSVQATMSKVSRSKRNIFSHLRIGSVGVVRHAI